MGKTAILAIKIISDAKGAVSGLNKAGAASDGAGKKHLLLNGALLAGAGLAVKFGKDAVGAFTSAASEVNPLKRNLGLTAESASRLRFQLKQSGVDVGAGNKALTIFTKNLSKWQGQDEALKATTDAKSKAIKAQIATLEAAGPKTNGYTEKMAALKAKLAAVTASGKANQNALKQLGVTYTDANGDMLPMERLMPSIADKFSKMPDGPQKTALAMKLFGKSGADMLPFLNKGAAGLAELSKKSDLYGQTLTGSNLDALKQSKSAQRDWSAAVEGFKIQFGAQLLPMLTAGATTLTSQLIPAITSGTQWLMANHDAVGAVVGVGVGLLGIIKTITSVTRAWAVVQGVLNVIMSANPIGLIILAIAALVAGFLYLWNTNAGFRDFFIGAWKLIAAQAALVAGWFTGTFLPAITGVWAAIVGGVTDLADKVATGWGKIVTFITGIPGKVTAAAAGFVTVLVTKGTDLVVGLYNGVTGKWATVTGWVGGMGAKIVSAVGNAGNWLADTGKNVVAGLWSGISGSYDWIKGKITSWVGDVVAFFKKVFGVNSPAKTMIPIGGALPEGLGIGVDRNLSTVLNPVRAMSAAVQSAFAPNLTVSPSVSTPALSAPVASSSGGAGSRRRQSADVIVHANLDRNAAGALLRDLINGEARFRGVVDLNGAVLG